MLLQPDVLVGCGTVDVDKLGKFKRFTLIKMMYIMQYWIITTRDILPYTCTAHPLPPPSILSISGYTSVSGSIHHPTYGSDLYQCMQSIPISCMYSGCKLCNEVEMGGEEF